MKTSELKRIAYYAYYSCLIVMVISLIAIVETSGMVIRMDDREASQAKLPAHRAMTDLQTYENDEYGITFKYDPQFSIAEINTGSGYDPAKPYILLWTGSTSDAPCLDLGCPPGSGDRDEFIKGTTYEGAPPLVPWYKLLRVQGKRWMSIQMTDVTDQCIDQEECSSHVEAMPFKELGKINDTTSKAYDSFIDLLGTLQFMNPVDTSTWQTYRNEEYGFEIQYPATWVVKPVIEHGPNDLMHLSLQNSNDSGIATSSMGISVSQVYPAIPDFDLRSPEGPMTIGGIPAREVAFPKGYCDGGGCSSPFVSLWATKNNIIYTVTIGNTADIGGENAQILSTFKFTK